VVSKIVVDVCRMVAKLLSRSYFRTHSLIFFTGGRQKFLTLADMVKSFSRAGLLQVAPTAQEWATITLGRVLATAVY